MYARGDGKRRKKAAVVVELDASREALSGKEAAAWCANEALRLLSPAAQLEAALAA